MTGWVAVEMCKVGKVCQARSLGGRRREDVSAEVAEKVKLLVLELLVGLTTAHYGRLTGCVLAEVQGWCALPQQSLEGPDLRGAAGAAVGGA